MYYFLYRVFNNFYLSKNYRDANTDKYVHDLFLRVLDDIEYTSDNEKIAMYNLVSNWTSVNRNNSVRVYGKSPVTRFVPDAEVSSRFLRIINEYWFTTAVVKSYPFSFLIFRPRHFSSMSNWNVFVWYSRCWMFKNCTQLRI